MSTDISKTTEMAGFVAACLVDSDTGLMLSSQGGGKLDLETVSSLAMQVLKAERQAIETLQLKDEIEDILITLGKQYHLIRPVAANPSLFIYVALERDKANPGMARLQLRNVESGLAAG